MKNNKALAVTGWIMAIAAIASAVLIGLGGMSKNVIVNLGIAVSWIIIGIVNRKK